MRHRLLQETKEFEAKVRRTKQKPYKLIGFNQMPDNTAVKIHTAGFHQGMFGDSDYKTRLTPVHYNFQDYDNPEEKGKHDFKSFFDKSWQTESWRKDVMIQAKTSIIDPGGGKDKVLKGGCMDADADGKGVDRHTSKWDWSAKW